MYGPPMSGMPSITSSRSISALLRPGQSVLARTSDTAWTTRRPRRVQGLRRHGSIMTRSPCHPALLQRDAVVRARPECPAALLRSWGGLPAAHCADPPLGGVPGHVVVIGDSAHAPGLLIDHLKIIRRPSVHPTLAHGPALRGLPRCFPRRALCLGARRCFPLTRSATGRASARCPAGPFRRGICLGR